MLTDGDIVLIVVKEANPKTGRIEEIISHGVEFGSGKSVVMSCDSPASIGAVFDSSIGEYVLKAKAK